MAVADDYHAGLAGYRERRYLGMDYNSTTHVPRHLGIHHGYSRARLYMAVAEHYCASLAGY